MTTLKGARGLRLLAWAVEFDLPLRSSAKGCVPYRAIGSRVTPFLPFSNRRLRKLFARSPGVSYVHINVLKPRFIQPGRSKRKGRGHQIQTFYAYQIPLEYRRTFTK